ncbi:keratin, type I cytoskeletal 10-like [Leptopilina boulardi]|uniref:keratin, type I cytoskeletal 10-like n=1 Tax=Leptopilina boulardi TaxID=63433 RepID=UPI0021F547C2|nr:keratin, type I cytoskeletal 10-like [Leptopilina boulardi]
MTKNQIFIGLLTLLAVTIYAEDDFGRQKRYVYSSSSSSSSSSSFGGTKIRTNTYTFGDATANAQAIADSGYGVNYPVQPVNPFGPVANSYASAGSNAGVFGGGYAGNLANGNFGGFGGGNVGISPNGNFGGFGGGNVGSSANANAYASTGGNPGGFGGGYNGGFEFAPAVPYGNGYGGLGSSNAQANVNSNGFNVFSRFGDGDIMEVSKSGNFEGGRGVFSSSSINIGPDGKGTYSIKTGNFP